MHRAATLPPAAACCLRALLAPGLAARAHSRAHWSAAAAGLPALTPHAAALNTSCPQGEKAAGAAEAEPAGGGPRPPQHVQRKLTRKVKFLERVAATKLSTSKGGVTKVRACCWAGAWEWCVWRGTPGRLLGNAPALAIAALTRSALLPPPLFCHANRSRRSGHR